MRKIARMRMFQCPRCQEFSLPFKDKYRAGMWRDIHCSHCKARLCASPWVLAAFFVLYVWDVGWFSGLYYYTHNPLDFVYMILVWIGLDFLNVWYMPLSIMRANPSR